MLTATALDDLLKSENDALRDKVFDLQESLSQALLKISELKRSLGSESRRFMTETIGNFREIGVTLKGLEKDQESELTSLRDRLQSSKKTNETRRRDWERREKDLLRQVKELQESVSLWQVKFNESDKTNKERSSRLAQQKVRLESLQTECQRYQRETLPQAQTEISNLTSKLSINDDCLVTLKRELQEKETRLESFEASLADLKETYNSMCKENENQFNQLNESISQRDLKIVSLERALREKTASLEDLKAYYEESMESQDKAYAALKTELQDAIKASKRKPSTVTIGVQSTSMMMISRTDSQTQTVLIDLFNPSFMILIVSLD